jgi:hypothetical protein
MAKSIFLCSQEQISALGFKSTQHQTWKFSKNNCLLIEGNQKGVIYNCTVQYASH